MKRGYDFSKGERGKFYHPGARLHLPVYLDAEVLVFVQRIAKRRKTDLSSVVNQLLRNDMHVAEILK
jgi:cytidylate kinase